MNRLKKTKIQNLCYLLIVLILLLFIKCDKKVASKNSVLNKPIRQVINIEKEDTLKKIEEKQKIENIDFEEVYNSFDSIFKPELITDEEFINFKKKSNYLEIIEKYDSKNSIELFGGKENEKNISYYPTPININEQEYANNSILFGDLNGDKKRDCIISVFRSNGYDEVTFFYVFINHSSSFRLESVTNETEICGCKTAGWPNRFRYQIIEDGFLKGVSMCHYKDAHCCPSIYLKTKVKFLKGKLQFDSYEFVMDDAIKYRPTPDIDSILVEKYN
jgi:hypothetical protein